MSLRGALDLQTLAFHVLLLTYQRIPQILRNNWYLVILEAILEAFVLQLGCDTYLSFYLHSFS